MSGDAGADPGADRTTGKAGAKPAASPAPLWRSYLALGRVSNLPTVWSNCLAGVILAGGVPNALLMLALVVSLSLFYTGGMFLNDAFDHRFDREFRPERPIPQGWISPRHVFLAGFLLLGAGELMLLLPIGVAVGAVGFFPAVPLLGGLALGGLITYYNYRHKTDPLSPLVMALCRALIYLIAGGMGGIAISATVGWGAVMLVCYLIGLTYVAKQENLTEVKNLWPLLFLAAPFVQGLPVLLRLSWESLLYAVFLGWVAYAISFLLRRQGRSIPRAVIGLIAGISLLDGLLIAGTGAPAVWAFAAGLGFVLTLFFQRYVAGT